MPRPPHPLQQRGDRTRRTELADEVHIADVDTQFQRRGGDQNLELAGLEPLFGLQAVFPGQASVMGGYLLLAASVRQMTATRSASRRVLTNTMVVRCAATRAARRS